MTPGYKIGQKLALKTAGIVNKLWDSPAAINFAGKHPRAYISLGSMIAPGLLGGVAGASLSKPGNRLSGAGKGALAGAAFGGAYGLHQGIKAGY
jgi:hypothetical protein